MSTCPIRRLATPTLALALALGVSSCGGESPTSPSPASASSPLDVAGFYHVKWTLEVLRKSDGFQKQFECYGELTLLQEATNSSTSSLRGFAVVDTPSCQSGALDISGSVSSDGKIEFTMDGPKPSEGPCRGGKDVHFTGQVDPIGDDRRVSARGETDVTCPEFGEHTFTYTIRAIR
jgi:hypothetical protein